MRQPSTTMKALGIVILGIVCTFQLCFVGAEIHRAKTTRQKYSHASKSTGRAASQYVSDTGLPNTNISMFLGHPEETWVYSILSAILVGLSGIFPLLVIPLEAGKALRKGAPAAHLRLLLSFAVGGLLGDVFLHLLPEAWCHLNNDGHDHEGHMQVGLWVLVGLLSFLCIEKIFPDSGEEQEGSEEDEDNHTKEKPAEQNNNTKLNGHVNPKNGHKKNGYIKHNCDNNAKEDKSSHNKQIKHRKSQNKGVHSNGVANGIHKTPAEAKPKAEKHEEEESAHIKTSGWLNLMANVIDNFTHGLAVAGSYCAGTKVGMVTTFAILVHEIPHEVGDFAILLRSGFDRWKAAKAQLLTASGGIIGAVTALLSESAKAAGDRTAWILPFTSGGFIYIALVTVVPDLLKETKPWESLKQMACLCAGIACMVVVTFLVD